MPAPDRARCVIVTRPQPQADTWVADLQSAGAEALALPLIAIGPPADPRPVRQAHEGLAALRLLVFVSPAAVAGFFDGAVALDWPARTLAAAPGPGTAQALRERGLPSACIVEPAEDAGQFDSESLWQAMSRRADTQDWTGCRVLLVGGSEGEQPSGRQWLAERLQEAGAQVAPLVAYRRTAAEIDAEGRALLARIAAEPGAHLWLFSSSEAITHLEAHLAAQAGAWPPVRAAALRAATVLATHPRIARTARDAGYADVLDTRPALADIVTALRRLRHSPTGEQGGTPPSIQSSAT